MFSAKQVIDAFKIQADLARDESLSHCQMLNAKAKELRFQSYNHLRNTLRSTPVAQLGALSVELMRRIAEQSLPSKTSAYCELYSFGQDLDIGFYSSWIGWDEHGNEVRVPRDIDAQATLPALRQISDFPIYVVETVSEFWTWKYHWHGTAYVPIEMARQVIPSVFRRETVVDNPPLDLIRKANCARIDQMIKKLKTKD